MIRVIVELYRIALALVLIFSVIVAVPVHAAFGLIGVIAYGVIVMMGFGVSAVLLSIHDHVVSISKAP